ncbi:GlsB/YeaQ/YmgE family stress response membrane protein [Alsobacter soli]|uniref:GlsB/YeaQ/YmgE family stress response membrane protein n=1 Tax=Alsobacter soli TaxID=2109933 RepID=A0A2T1HXD4_9HYPH|nr:GlsB/YeaQ/YmgE family stress response membrane protein [Alsobacter soli]PSC06356.1 GlsB/YeaQ/YmgE family stress response membrane protein [Alsobacter soli]
MDEQTYGALGNPGMGFFAMLVVGVLAGWIAEKITESRHGLFTNLLVGIAGSFVGGKLAELLNVPVFGFFRTLVAAVIGAVLVLWIWRQVRGRPPGY